MDSEKEFRIGQHVTLMTTGAVFTHYSAWAKHHALENYKQGAAGLEGGMVGVIVAKAPHHLPSQAFCYYSGDIYGVVVIIDGVPQSIIVKPDGLAPITEPLVRLPIGVVSCEPVTESTPEPTTEPLFAIGQRVLILCANDPSIVGLRGTVVAPPIATPAALSYLLGSRLGDLNSHLVWARWDDTSTVQAIVRDSCTQIVAITDGKSVPAVTKQIDPPALVVDDGVRYMHMRPDRQDTRSGGFTVAYRLEDGKIYYGVALCHTDDNFSRSKGRTEAHKRLKDNMVDYQRMSLLFTNQQDRDTPVRDIVRLLFTAAT